MGMVTPSARKEVIVIALKTITVMRKWTLSQ